MSPLRGLSETLFLFRGLGATRLRTTANKVEPLTRLCDLHSHLCLSRITNPRQRNF